MKEEVWAFLDVLGLFVCMYVQGFCGVVGGVVWKKREAGSDVGLGLGLGLGGAILQIPSFFLFLASFATCPSHVTYHIDIPYP